MQFWKSLRLMARLHSVLAKERFGDAAKYPAFANYLPPEDMLEMTRRGCGYSWMEANGI